MKHNSRHQALRGCRKPARSRVKKRKCVLNSSNARAIHMHAGTWCSGITSALHAEGPGFNPQCVHAWFLDELLIDTLVDWRSRWAHGVVVSHPLCMRKALGSNPSVSNVGLRPCCAHQGRAFHVGRRSSPQGRTSAELPVGVPYRTSPIQSFVPFRLGPSGHMV